MSGDFLEQMASASRERVARARQACPEQSLMDRARSTSPAPTLRLSTRGFDLIAELKRRSPVLGVLAGEDGDEDASEGVRARVCGYAEAGAAAVSVLTEPSRFDGTLEHLQQSVQALAGRIPAMRKDFLVDPYQVYEARAAGAGGILVILRMLSSSQQRALIEACAELGMFALLEAFDEADLERAAELVEAYTRGRGGRGGGGSIRSSGNAASVLLVGVNCRDLGTLQVVPGRLEALAGRLPAGVPHVAESGVRSAEDAARLALAGYDVALVGGALMQSGDPGALARSLLAAGRAAVRRTCGSRSAG
ncbi:MAG TPA: indole-3-glycerol-phosphate synthase [Steroidobacteraceae bacterium]|jgi:indole-3-glycerol phosphate synthase|nr:indole-3-glycerol-phosphate synthase [Steroidobacteraceae bacterium]